jgi:O-antigen/teichoic acid export membrane protein
VVTGVITARALGPSGKGELTAILLWPALLSIVGGLGLTDAVVYFGAQMPRHEREVVGTGLFLALCQSLLFVAIGLVVIPLALGRYGPQVVSSAMLYLTWIPLYSLSLIAMGLLQGKLQLGAFNSLRVTLVAATVLGMLALVAVHRVSIFNIVALYLIANSVTLLLAVGLVSRLGWLSFRPSKEMVRKMLPYGLKSHAGNVAGFTNERADQAVISLFLSSANLGWYAVAVTLASALGLFSSAMSLIAFPVVAGADRETMRRYLSRFTQISLVMSVLIAAVLMVTLPLLITVFFGSAFLPATNAARILLLAGVVLSTNRLLSYGLKAFNRPLVPGIAELLAAGVTVACLALLLPFFGLAGAALASLLAYGTSLLFMTWFFNRDLQLSPRELFVPSVRDIDWLKRKLRRSPS